MIFKYINVPLLIVSFAIGMFFVYMTTSADRRIIVYPTHENYHLLQYRDKTGTCFSIQEKEVTCPTNPSLISKIPAQS